MYLLTSSASTNSATAATPTIRMTPDKPSRNSGSTKARNTSADPVSCCRNTNAIGISTMAAATTLVPVCFHSTPMVDMYFDSASAVANLANSDGCRRKNPRSIHDLPPCDTVAMNSVTTSSASTTP